MQGRTVKRVEDNVEADLDDLSAGTDFLKKKQEQKPEKKINLTSVKFRTFVYKKPCYRIWKYKPLTEKRYLAHRGKNRFMFRIYKEFIQIRLEWQATWTVMDNSNGQKPWTGTSPKKKLGLWRTFNLISFQGNTNWNPNEIPFPPQQIGNMRRPTKEFLVSLWGNYHLHTAWGKEHTFVGTSLDII